MDEVVFFSLFGGADPDALFFFFPFGSAHFLLIRFNLL